jgi:hypothetical protein
VTAPALHIGDAVHVHTGASFFDGLDGRVMVPEPEGGYVVALDGGCRCHFERSELELLGALKRAEYLIWSHQHGKWWGPAWRGYTSSHRDAGRYSKEEAQEIIAKSRYGWRPEQPVPPEVAIEVPEVCVALTLEMAVADATERVMAARHGGA